MCVSVALGLEQGEDVSSFPDAHVSSVSLCMCELFCVCFCLGFCFLFFFFNKEKKMCIFLAMTET